MCHVTTKNKNKSHHVPMLLVTLCELKTVLKFNLKKGQVNNDNKNCYKFVIFVHYYYNNILVFS